MAKKKLTNDWTGTLHLELAQDERGLGATHVSLAVGKSITVEDDQISAQISHLAGIGKKRRISRKTYLKIEDVATSVEVEEFTESPPLEFESLYDSAAEVDDDDSDVDDEDI